MITLSKNTHTFYSKRGKGSREIKKVAWLNDTGYCGQMVILSKSKMQQHIVKVMMKICKKITRIQELSYVHRTN